MQYSLVPGTNQLIKGYPGYGSQLFNQYGYQIDRPRNRDYYNMLRGNQGLQFADSLAQLLVKIWPTGPHATGTPATTPAALSTGLALSNTPGNAGYNPAALFNSNKAFSKSISANETGTSSFIGERYGNGQWPMNGPDPITRLNAYHELLRHTEHWDRQEREPRYFIQNSYLLPGQSFELPESYNQASLPQPEIHDSWFMAHKKMIIISALVIGALVLYLKLNK